MVKIVRRFIPAGILLILLIILFSGCAGNPKIKDSYSVVSLLPGDQSVYGNIKVRGNEDILSNLLTSLDIAPELQEIALDRTDSIAFSLGRGEEKPFTILVSGDFPKAVIQGKIRKQKTWKKEKDIINYWVNEEMGIALTFLGSDIIAVTSGPVSEVIRRYAEKIPARDIPRDFLTDIPRELELEFSISDAVLYMPLPGKMISEAFESSKDFPIELVWITLFYLQREEQYDVSAVFRMSSEEDAVSFSKFVKLLLLVMLKREGIGDIKSLPQTLKVTQRGTSVRIQGIPLTSEDISGFFRNKL